MFAVHLIGRPVLGMALALVMLLACRGADAQDRPITVGIYQNAPKVFLDGSGKPSGFFPEILDHIASQEGWSLQYVPCDWDACLTSIENGTLDLMLDVAYSRSRAERFDFNREVVLANWSTLYVPSHSNIQSIMDVHGRSIAVVKDSIQRPLFQEWALSSGVRPHFIEVESYTEVFEAIQSGKADGGLVNRLFGTQFSKDYAVKRTNVVMAPSQLHFVVSKHKNHALLDAIDRHLAGMKQDGHSVYQAAIERWIVAAEQPSFPAWIWWTLAATVSGLGLALSFVGLLRWEVNKKTAALKRTNRLLQAILSVNETLVRSVSEQDLLDKICQVAVEHGDSFLAWVGFVDQDSPAAVRIVARHCADPSFLEQAEQTWSGLLAPGGLLDHTILSGHPILGRRLNSVPTESLPSMSGKSLYVTAIPLRISLRNRGVFCVFTDGADLFHDGMEKLLLQMAEDLSFGIHSLHEAQLKLETTRRLHQAEKMDALGNMAGGIAHDLKNMLLPIISLTQLTIDQMPEDSPDRKTLGIVIDAAERAHYLTEKIHSFSYKDSAAQEEIDAGTLIEDCLPILRASITPSISIDFTCEAAAEQRRLRLDAARFETMLLNLCSNAADAIGQGVGSIHLSLSRVSLDSLSGMDIPAPQPGPYLKLTFVDTGTGMDEATIRRIFEPYFTTKEQGKGAGLGMAMVQKFIVDQGGGMTVSSAPGHGTTFSIFLAVPDRP